MLEICNIFLFIMTIFVQFIRYILYFSQSKEYNCARRILFHMRIRNRIQEVMWIKGITQEELCKTIGMKQSYLSEIVNGERNVQITTAQKFAKALGKSMDFLWPYK